MCWLHRSSLEGELISQPVDANPLINLKFLISRFEHSIYIVVKQQVDLLYHKNGNHNNGNHKITKHRFSRNDKTPYRILIFGLHRFEIPTISCTNIYVSWKRIFAFDASLSLYWTRCLKRRNWRHTKKKRENQKNRISRELTQFLWKKLE